MAAVLHRTVTVKWYNYDYELKARLVHHLAATIHAYRGFICANWQEITTLLIRSTDADAMCPAHLPSNIYPNRNNRCRNNKDCGSGERCCEYEDYNGGVCVPMKSKFVVMKNSHVVMQNMES